MCSSFCKALTFDGDTSSNELDFELTHGGDIIHDEEERTKIIKNSFHSLSFPVVHGDYSLVQVTHEIRSIYSYLEVQSEELYNLGNMFVKDVNYDQINNVDGCQLDTNDIFSIIDGSCPYTMHDLTQSSKRNSTILESSGTHQGVEALQL